MVELCGVSKSFHGRFVVRDVSHVFNAGCAVGVFGPSGSGKTTLLRLIMGLDQPDEGRLVRAPGLRLGAVFQEDRLIEHWDARANVRLVAPDLPEAELERHLSALGLDGEDGKRVERFSGGMRRRVALARALAVRPDLLILDEPFKGLDANSRDRAVAHILAEKGQAGLIIATHDQAEARALGMTERIELRGTARGENQTVSESS